MTGEELRQLLSEAKVIAVVGLSANPDRPSNQVAWYLHHQGYRLFGVNPECPEPEVFGVPMVPPSTRCPSRSTSSTCSAAPRTPPRVARAAAGAGALWLQLGIASPEARAIAEEASLRYVEDRRLKVDHARLLGRSRAGRERS